MTDVATRRKPRALWANSVGPGWQPLVDGFLALAEAENVVVYQIKEKFGGLRIYADSGLQETITKLELIASHTCEECGGPGVIGDLGKGWLKTLCDKCRQQRAK